MREFLPVIKMFYNLLIKYNCKSLENVQDWTDGTWTDTLKIEQNRKSIKKIHKGDFNQWRNCSINCAETSGNQLGMTKPKSS